ncbi:MAG: tetratricopeptide repeat protein, partial [Vicinamibacteria bacterium]
PRDWNTINKIGDLFAKIGKMREAGDEYAKVAEFYARDGFHLKAIAIWKKINKLDPAVIEPYAKLADLYAKQGLVMEAKGQYQIVSEDQMKRGRLKEAAETLRKMVEIDSSDLKTRSRLADIYTKEGSTAKAVGEYIAISEELNLKGHPAEAIQVLEKGLKIDGGIKVKIQLGRVHLAQRSYEKAIAYLEEVTAQEPTSEGLMQLGQAYLGAKRVSDAQSTLESVLEKSPESQEARIILVQIYAVQGRSDEAYDAVIPLVEQLLLRRDADRAANLLVQITNRSPHHVRTLQKLVEVARVRQNDRAIVQALNQLLEAHLAAGSDRAAEDTAAQLVEVEPDNEQFKARLESLKKKKSAPVLSGPAKVAVEKRDAADMTLPPPSTSIGTSDLDGLEFDTGAIVRPQGMTADSNTDREFIEEHLAESRVFRKYGLLDKAEEQVDLVLVRYPNIFDGRFEKKEIFKETERIEEAAKECVWLAEVAAKDGNESLATMLSSEAETLWPGITASTEEPAAEGTDAEAADDSPLLTSSIAIPADLSLGPDVSFGDDLPLGGDLSLGPDVALGDDLPLGDDAPADVGPPALDLELPLVAAGEEEEEDLASSFEDEPVAAAPADEADVPDSAFSAESLGFEDTSVADAEEAAAMAAGFGEPTDDAELSPAELPDAELPGLSSDLSMDMPDQGPDVDFASGTVPRPTPAALAVDPEIAKALEEVDSYIALGFVDDAKDALRDAIERYPGDPSVIERASRLGLDLSASEAPAASEPMAAPPVAAPVAAPVDLEVAAPADEAAAAENDLLSGFSFDDLPAPPPEPEPVVTPAAVKMSVADAAPVSDGGGIDLGAELSALFDAQPALEEAPLDTSRSSSFEDQGLQDVFNEFKKGVDSQLGEGDYDTRYNLGIAYKEMGLVDEAIAEFQLAAKDPKRSLECSSMIGICFMEKGMPDIAVQWYERGLQVPDRAPEEYRGLRYDLGMAWESAGDIGKARITFGDLVREDPSFRDVSEKLRELQSRA